MTIRDVLLPLFVQVTLTFVLLFWMAALRTRAFGHGLKPADIALRQPNWPPEVTKIANAFHNQLEIPILFYALTILAGTPTTPARCSSRSPGCSSPCASSMPSSM